MSYLDDLLHRICLKDRPGREAVALLAGLQHGVVARWELLALGIGWRQIQTWLASGQLIRVYRGVYGVGHDRVTLKRRWMAAVLAGGPNAVLSHRAAIALHELRRAGGGPVDVTVPGR